MLFKWNEKKLNKCSSFNLIKKKKKKIDNKKMQTINPKNFNQPNLVR